MTPDDGFLIPWHSCECHEGYRCGNHDDAAEEAYWFGPWQAQREVTAADIEGAYPVGHYKARALLGEFA